MSAAPDVVAAGKLSCGGAKDRFILHLYGASQSTRATYGHIIDKFCRYLSGKPLDQITVEDIEQFLMRLQSKGYKATSINLYLAALRSYFAWLEDNYDIPNKAKKVSPLKTLPPHQRILSEDEYSCLKGLSDSKDKACVVFLANSGLRAAEFINLTSQSVTSDFITVIGKGSRQRSVPVNKNIRAILETYPHFLDFTKSIGSTRQLRRICLRVAKRAKIAPFSPHSLRHYFATQLRRKGISIDIISKLMGHTSPLVTAQIYIHWQLDDLRHVTDVLT